MRKTASRDNARHDVLYALLMIAPVLGSVSISWLADECEMHPNTVRAALNFLMEMKLVSWGRHGSEPAEYWLTGWGHEVVDMFEAG